MTPEERLRQEDPEAFAAFCRIRRRLTKYGEWKPEYAIGLEPVAKACAFYLHEARALRTVADPELRKELAAYSEELRMMVRESLIEFGVLDEELAKFAMVDAEGLDTTIAALCARLPEPVT